MTDESENVKAEKLAQSFHNIINVAVEVADITFSNAFRLTRSAFDTATGHNMLVRRGLATSTDGDITGRGMFNLVGGGMAGLACFYSLLASAGGEPLANAIVAPLVIFTGLSIVPQLAHALYEVGSPVVAAESIELSSSNVPELDHSPRP